MMSKRNLKLNQLFSDNVEFTKDVEGDLAKFDGSSLFQIIKVINKVAENPKPYNEGGYGMPLRNSNYSKLANYCKIKIKKPNVRIIYKVKKDNDKMVIIIVAARADDYVYKEADKRIRKFDGILQP